MERTIRTAAPMDWDAVRFRLTGLNQPAVLKMIDGELAFPDEPIPADWKEVRFGLPGGMVTVRRMQDTISTVVWGNAEESLLKSWNAITLAIASSVQACVSINGRSLTADEFALQCGLQPG